MTEEEWKRSNQPVRMIRHLGERASKRKLRLLACADCRDLWEFLCDKACRKAIEVAERLADGLAGEDEQWKASMDAYQSLQSNRSSLRLAAVAAISGDAVVLADIIRGTAAQATAEMKMSGDGGRRSRHQPDDFRGQRGKQAVRLRCLFGNPFQPIVLDPRWVSSTVKQLATLIYEERQFSNMPILGDALEEAGCDNQDVLKHCRRSVEHSRGCFVVDLVLGRA